MGMMGSIKPAGPSVEGIEGIQKERAFAPLSQGESIALLTHTAEAALARVAAMSELGGLLMQLQQTTGYTNDAWFVTDPQGHYLSMNASAELFCGMRDDTVGVGRNTTLEDIFAHLLSRIRDRETARLYLREFVQEGQEEQEWSEQRRDLRCVITLKAESVENTTLENYKVPNATTHGKFHSQSDTAPTDQYYQLMRYPLYNSQGLLVGRALLVHDITTQVHDEKNKAALLASVSHDLRTPLTTIKAAVSGLMGTNMTWDEVTYREILADINTESDHLEVLVTDLIEMSRIEMGALVLEKEWCDILEVLYGALARLEALVGERKILFHTDASFQAELPLLYADHVQLERAFFYLMEHVAHDTEDIVEMQVHVEAVGMAHGEHLRVQIIDCGKGIPVGEREGIFKTFYRPATHGNGHPYGSGLGLAICRGIVDAHHGQISVETLSDDRRRACFTCMLPLHQQNGISVEHLPPVTHSLSETRVCARGVTLMKLKGKRILVVDDEPPIQRMLRRNLIASGYEVHVASEGDQAIEMIRLLQPDLILLDLCLPGELNGLDVCVYVRNEALRIPVIVLSALTDEKRKVQALDEGADDYLTKPFSNDELQARVRVCLRRASAMEPAQGLVGQPQILKSDDGYLSMDIAGRQVRAGDQDVRLTPTEFELLRQLMLYAGKVLTHRSLLRAVWGPEYGEEADYLRVYVRQLRRKIKVIFRAPVTFSPSLVLAMCSGQMWRCNIYNYFNIILILPSAIFTGNSFCTA